jgi:hypothetical protein
LAKFRIKLSDTITIARETSCVVDVPSRAFAEGTALWMSHSGLYPLDVVSGQKPGNPLDFIETHGGHTPFQIDVEPA